jgi:uncharacterized protein (TIGR00251 family)
MAKSKNKKEDGKSQQDIVKIKTNNSQEKGAIRLLGDIIQVHITVKPNAKQSLIYWDGELLRADLQSPPDKSKANQELIKLIAGQLKCSSSQVHLIAGHTNRDKILNIINLHMQIKEIESIFGEKK